MLRFLPQTATPQRRYTGPSVLENDAQVTTSTTPPSWKCIPPPPAYLLEDERVLLHPAVVGALANIRLVLNGNAKVFPNDAVSFSIVHQAKGKIFDFHSGRVRTNESSIDSPALVDGDSIYRIASITKTFVVLEALILGRQSQLKGLTPELTLDTRLKAILPEFDLPASWGNEAEEITLAQLGSHMTGLPRDVGELELDDLRKIEFPVKPGGLDLLEGFPHDRNESELLNLVSKNDLIWPVGQMPSYSNTGFSLFGFAVEKYRNKMLGSHDSFGDILRDDIFAPLNMSNSFLGPIPGKLRKHVVVPNARNLVDRVFPSGHDPAGGMFSSVNDLSNLLYRVLLSRKPELISPSQRLGWLKTVHHFTDGVTSVGIPWETIRAILPDFSSYNIYMKGGGLPSQSTLISTFPEYGYSVVALTSVGISTQDIMDGGKYSNPGALTIQAHNILIPALWAAYGELQQLEFAGVYVSSDGFARISFKEGILSLDTFFSKGTDVLLKWDQIYWSEAGKRPRMFDRGAKLWGHGFDGIFRASPIDACSWGAFDAVTTKKGWGYDKFVIRSDKDEKKVLRYDMMKAKLYKVAPGLEREYEHLFSR